MELNGHQLAGRQRIVGAMVLGVGLLFVFRLFQMQVTTDDWKNRAERLTEEQEVLQPARGLCLDRHGELLVNNVPSYDLMVVPRSLSDVDTSALAELVGTGSARAGQTTRQGTPVFALQSVPSVAPAQCRGIRRHVV